MSSPSPQKTRAANTASLPAVDRYLDRVFDALRGSSWGDALRFRGVDLLDAARSPLFVALLAAARTPKAHVPHRGSTRTWQERLRRYAIDRQLPRPLLEWKSRRRSQRPPRGGLLFWPREPTHLSAIEPVVRALAERAEAPRPGYLVCQPRLFEPATLSGRATVTLTRAEWPDLVRRVEAIAPPILDTTDESIAAYLPQSSEVGLTANRVERTFRDVLNRQLPTLIESILATERIVDELAPHVLVVGNDLTIEGRAATRAAQLSNVPTAAMMHGAITADPLQRHHVVDRFLVYGPAHREELEQLGFASEKTATERIAVVGNPRLDSLPRGRGETEPSVRALAGIDSSRPWILVASSGAGHRTSLAHHRQLIEAIDELARALPDVRIVVKLHRKDRREHYPKHPRYAIVEHGAPGAPESIFDWLRGCTAVVTGASTVAIEAMLMEVPVVTVDLLDEFEGVDFIDARATHHTRSTEALVQVARELVRGERRAPEDAVAALLDRSFAHRGASAQAALDALLAMSETASLRGGTS